MVFFTYYPDEDVTIVMFFDPATSRVSLDAQRGKALSVDDDQLTDLRDGAVTVITPEAFKDAILKSREVRAAADAATQQAITAYLAAVRRYNFGRFADPNRGKNTELYEAAGKMPEDHLLYLDVAAVTAPEHRLATCNVLCVQTFPRSKIVPVGQPYSMMITDVRRLQVNPQTLSTGTVSASGSTDLSSLSSPKTPDNNTKTGRSRRNQKKRDKRKKKEEEMKNKNNDSRITTSTSTSNATAAVMAAATPLAPKDRDDGSPPHIPLPEYVHVLGPLLVPSNRHLGYFSLKGFRESDFQVVVDVADEKKPVWIVYDYFPRDPETGVWRSGDYDVPFPLQNDTLQDVWPGIRGCALEGSGGGGLFDIAMLMDSFDDWGTLSAEEMAENLRRTATLRGLEISAISVDDERILKAGRQDSSN